DGKNLAAERVRQETLQGFDLAPPPGLNRFHDTRLEPPHDRVDLPPVNGVPVREVARGRTSLRHRRCHLLCLLRGWPSSLVGGDPAEVGPLSRGMIPHPYPGDYGRAFASSAVLYPPPHPLASRLAFPIGRATGLPCSAELIAGTG